MTHGGGWPKISVVTPSFNQGAFIEQTLRSVIDQGYENLEYIVMDGGSTDGTHEILRRYQSQLAYLSEKPDGGQAEAIAAGFARSSGEILGWLNSDDMYEPGAIRAVGALFAKHPEVDVIYGDVRLIDSVGATIQVVPSIDFHWKTALLENSLIPQPTAFFRRSCYERIGGVDPQWRFSMDFDLWVRLFKAGAHMHRVNQTLASFRLHAAGKTMSIPEVQLVERAKIVHRELGRAPTKREDYVLTPVLRLRRLALQTWRNPTFVLRRVFRRTVG